MEALGARHEQPNTKAKEFERLSTMKKNKSKRKERKKKKGDLVENQHLNYRSPIVYWGGRGALLMTLTFEVLLIMSTEAQKDENKKRKEIKVWNMEQPRVE